MRRALYLIASSLFLGLPAATALAVSWHLEKDSRPTAGGPGNTFELRGIWPNSCVPEVVSISTDNSGNHNSNIRLQTRAGGSNCAARPSPFSLYFPLPETASPEPEFYWFHQSGPDQPERLTGFRILVLTTGQADIRPASGWWWPEPGVRQESGPGTGLTVDHQNGLLTLITQFFDSQGEPEWLLGTAAIRGGVSNMELLKFTGGQTLTGAYLAPLVTEAKNAIHIRFDSASRAEVWLEERQGDTLAEPIKLRKLRMVRYFMDPPVQARLLIGRWLVISEDRPDYAELARGFRVTRLTEKENGRFGLIGLADKSVGECVLHEKRHDSPPASCRITSADGERTWRFHSFDIDRMRGKDADGGRVIAYRAGPL